MRCFLKINCIIHESYIEPDNITKYKRKIKKEIKSEKSEFIRQNESYTNHARIWFSWG